MDKELFISIINKCEELHREQEEFNDVLHKIDNEFGGGYIYNKVIDFLSELAVKMIGDDYDNISYYMWELDFGKEYKDGMITDQDGNILKMSTPEELYDLIMLDK